MIFALLKMFGVLVLVFFIILFLFVMGIFNKLFGRKGPGSPFSTGGSAGPMFGGTTFRGNRTVERCPSCHQMISVPKEPGNCPKCGTLLGRNHEGKLLIRLN